MARSTLKAGLCARALSLDPYSGRVLNFEDWAFQGPLGTETGFPYSNPSYRPF